MVVLATLILASACTRTAVIPRAAGISGTVAALPAPVLPSARLSATAKPAETTGGIRTNSAGAILP
ncbi:MAG: hypothetical protein QOF95_3202, partial [Pseudonocardiales bacterium]|nr:hypothetical protein [Pseudonocardiales bacterium]